MPYGLQIFNSSGQNTFTVTDSLTKSLTSFSVSSNGSASYPDLAGRTLYFFVYRISTDPFLYQIPVITRSGNTVSWTYNSTYSRSPARIILGYY
jgi:hypothetical protein